jgi:tRNA(Ile)-lysidine synthase
MAKKSLLPTEPVRRVLGYIDAEGMRECFSGGVLLALSGGADSVFLAHLLSWLSEEWGFRLFALHVHHHLRGEEADRDAEFCRRLAETLRIPFRVADVDVRGESERMNRGLEESARLLRYRALRAALAEEGLAVIATAHHATDHLETVLHRILRGGGIRALLGIRPRRSDLVRPLLCLGRSEIEAALCEAGIPYVTDTTNFDTAYTRNYLRAEVLPRLSRIVPDPEAAAMRMSEALSHDAALLDELAAQALAEAPRRENGVEASYLASLPEAIRRRVLRLLYEEKREPEAVDIPLEYTHTVAISRFLAERRTSFSLAVPNRLFAYAFDGYFEFRRGEVAPLPFCGSLSVSSKITALPPDFLVTVRRGDKGITVGCSSKFYKIDIETAISSDIINGELYVRTRQAGDAYFFRGHTHSLKKLLNERRVPPELRPHLPILCDDEGILWVPFCPVREKRKGKIE